jgi:hypothetical protein
MRNSLNVVFLAAAVVLLVFGFQAADSIASSFSRFFSGTPTDHSMWLILGGVVCAIIGLVGFARAPRLAR